MLDHDKRIPESSSPASAPRRSPAARWLAIGLLTATSVLSAACGHTQRTIPKSEWLSALDPVTAGTVRLNNYSPTPVPGQPPVQLFHLANDSSFALPAPLVTFDIPIARQEPYTFYIQDMRSEAITTDAERGRALIRIAFEDDGAELVGNCVDNWSCICGDPRIDLDDSQLDLMFRLAARDNQLVLSQPGARFASGFSETGPCRENVCAAACDLFAPDRENQARAAIESRAQGLLVAQQAVIEAALNARLRSIIGAATPISSAMIQANGDLLLLIPD